MILYDFECECGNVFEEWGKMSKTTHVCELCNSQARRMISAPIIKLDPLSGDFYGATKKWEKRHKQMGQTH